MPHDPRKYLRDVVDGCAFVLALAANRSEDDYRSDRVFRSALERELQIIGEAVMQLARVAPRCAAGISEHKRIIGFRHVLVHGYGSLNPETVWALIQDKLPLLQREAEGLLGACETEP